MGLISHISWLINTYIEPRESLACADMDRELIRVWVTYNQRKLPQKYLKKKKKRLIQTAIRWTTLSLQPKSKWGIDHGLNKQCLSRWSVLRFQVHPATHQLGTLKNTKINNKWNKECNKTNDSNLHASLLMHCMTTLGHLYLIKISIFI